MYNKIRKKFKHKNYESASFLKTAFYSYFLNSSLFFFFKTAFYSYFLLKIIFVLIF